MKEYCMPVSDIETGLSEEDRAIEESVHRFAEDVLRPTGRALDRLPDPADVVFAACVPSTRPHVHCS